MELRTATRLKSHRHLVGLLEGSIDSHVSLVRLESVQALRNRSVGRIPDKKAMCRSQQLVIFGLVVLIQIGIGE